MTHPSSLAFYRAEQVRELDRRAIEVHGIPGYTLMQRAAAAAWTAATTRLPRPQRVRVCAGSGNNGGDGYEIARLVRGDGIDCQVIELPGERRGDAATARAAWLADGGCCIPFAAASLAAPAAGCLIVDAIFGTGLSRAPGGAAAEAIEAINAARAQGALVLAVDLPSGLMADSGEVPGVAVGADVTVSFIGRKLGLHAGEGPDLAGELVFDWLDVPAEVYEGVPAAAQLLGDGLLRRRLGRRPRSAHKGRNGHVLLVGGDGGTNGALLMAGRAALRSGAGLVSVATRAAHASSLAIAQPELMPHGVEDRSMLQPLLNKADVIAIGPGLGTGAWGRAMLSAALGGGLPLVIDADALNLLAQAPQRRDDWVLTPHPGEAARLLQTRTDAVQKARFAAASELAARYGGICVLKGAGTLVRGERLGLCPHGNPGMAVGGMGDALTGVIAAMIGQGLALEDAAGAGVAAHALAGDHAATGGERGLLPSDLIEALRGVVNP